MSMCICLVESSQAGMKGKCKKHGTISSGQTKLGVLAIHFVVLRAVVSS